MSVKLSERTKRMRKNFMKERREGKNIAQIAKEYEMNVSTVYSSLQIIADENNVSRESLLEKMSGPHSWTDDRKKRKKLEEVDVKLLSENFEAIVENIDIIVLGLPRNMNNTIGERANKTIEFRDKLSKYLNMEVYMQDERLSSVEANNYLIQSDMSRKKRKTKVDSVAATIILETFMERRKNNER